MSASTPGGRARSESAVSGAPPSKKPKLEEQSGTTSIQIREPLRSSRGDDLDVDAADDEETTESINWTSLHPRLVFGTFVGREMAAWLQHAENLRIDSNRVEYNIPKAPELMAPTVTQDKTLYAIITKQKVWTIWIFEDKRDIGTGTADYVVQHKKSGDVFGRSEMITIPKSYNLSDNDLKSLGTDVAIRMKTFYEYSPHAVNRMPQFHRWQYLRQAIFETWPSRDGLMNNKTTIKSTSSKVALHIAVQEGNSVTAHISLPIEIEIRDFTQPNVIVDATQLTKAVQSLLDNAPSEESRKRRKKVIDFLCFINAKVCLKHFVDREGVQQYMEDLKSMYTDPHWESAGWYDGYRLFQDPITSDSTPRYVYYTVTERVRQSFTDDTGTILKDFHQFRVPARANARSTFEQAYKDLMRAHVHAEHIFDHLAHVCDMLRRTQSATEVGIHPASMRHQGPDDEPLPSTFSRPARAAFRREGNSRSNMPAVPEIRVKTNLRNLMRKEQTFHKITAEQKAVELAEALEVLDALEIESVNDGGGLQILDAYLNGSRPFNKTTHDKLVLLAGQSPSVDAVSAFCVKDGLTRIHIGQNSVGTRTFVNILKHVYHARILIYIWKFDSDPTPDEFNQLVLLMDHLYLQRKQVPWQKLPRLKANFGSEFIAEWQHQSKTGLATIKGCNYIKQQRNDARLYKMYGMRRFAATSTPLQHDVPNRDGVMSILRKLELDYNVTFPVHGGAPYLFEGGPRPLVWSWEIWTALLCAHLEVLTFECDKYYVTKVTVEVLLVVQAYQWITRKDRNSETREWMGLPMSLYAAHPLNMSIGKPSHGLSMSSGTVFEGALTSIDQLDPSQWNLVFQTWITNMAWHDWDHERDELHDDFKANLKQECEYWSSTLPVPGPSPVDPYDLHAGERVVVTADQEEDLIDVWDPELDAEEGPEDVADTFDKEDEAMRLDYE